MDSNRIKRKLVITAEAYIDADNERDIYEAVGAVKAALTLKADGELLSKVNNTSNLVWGKEIKFDLIPVKAST